MHISKKLKSILARAPVLFLLLLIFTVGHPVRAQAADADVTLEENMDHFVPFTTGKQMKYVIETNGKKLEEMFPGTDLEAKSQYFAYFKVDVAASAAAQKANRTWSTLIEYWHAKPFAPNSKGDIRIPDGTPKQPLAKNGVVFKINVEDGEKGTGCGKQSFTKYKTYLNDTSWNYVDSGCTGTLHYFCIDKGTEAGNALAKLKKGQKSKDNKVTFYVSSVKKDHHNGRKYYSMLDWYNRNGSGKTSSGAYVKGDHYVWKDRDLSHYRAHYNNKFVLEIPTVKITQRASLIGKRMKTSDAFEYQPKLNVRSDEHNHNYVRSLDASDYFFRPKFKNIGGGKQKQVLLKVKNSKGKLMEGKTVDYVPYEDAKSGNSADPVELKSPVATKDTDPTITYTEGGKQKSAVLVGFTVYKKVDTGGETAKKIFLSNCMIKMKKESSNQYRPYYVEETAKNKTAETPNDVAGSTESGVTNNGAQLVNEDSDKDGATIAIPANVLDRHVTVMTYKKFGKKGDKLKLTNTKNISLKTWARDLNGSKNSRKAYWLMIKKLGIRNEDEDTTTELVVDWLYAPVDVSSTVTLEQYYVDYNNGRGEKLHYEKGDLPDGTNIEGLSYNHKNINKVKAKLVHRTELEQVDYGAPWVSYSVKRNRYGAYKLSDGTTYPKKGDAENAEAQSGLSTKFENPKPKKVITRSKLIPKNTYVNDNGNRYAKSYIPYTLKGSDPYNNKYLYKVRIKTEYDGKWTQFTASDIWGIDYTIANGELTNDRGYLTKAPYMKRYVYDNNPKLGAQMNNIRSRGADWQKDAYNMTHFIIPECRGNITVQAYYTSTVPVRILTYSKSGSSEYKLTDFQQFWCTSGQNFKGTFPISNDQKIAAIFCASGTKAYSQPYGIYNRCNDSFNSVHHAEQYYPERSDITESHGSFNVKVPAEPITIVVMLKTGSPSDKYFTQVQYVHTQDGQYHFIKSWTQPIRTHTQNGCNTVRAFVSFPQYVSYDDGNTGLYGSLYKENGVFYEYSDSKNFPEVTKTGPGKYKTSNNFENGIYLTQKGHDKFESLKNYNKTDYAVRNPAGGDNSLICYCIYEDYFNQWTNEQYNPVAESNNPKTEEEKSIYWNWPLPNGFVWEDADIESKDTVDQTRYENEDGLGYSNPFIAQVMGTNDSAAFDAQQGIPTTDFVRTQAQVPRYLTKGYYNKEMIDWAYKIYAVYVKQHKTTTTIRAGHNSTGNRYVRCTFDYYTSDPVYKGDGEGNKDGYLEVQRHGVYYKLGDAEVWDPYSVTMKNDVFCDTSISENGLVTMEGYGKQGGYASKARFFKLSEGNFTLPDLTVVRQYVNYGTYNDWAAAEDALSDLKNFQNDAESIVGKVTCNNDKVTFFDGLGTTYTLSSDEVKAVTQKPSFPPEADLTSAGIFDSKNRVSYGIQIQPSENNGHHETCSIAYYKQIQCIPTDKYKTDEMIKTKILDDGDDDVTVYTPTYCGSVFNLDYNLTETDSNGVRLAPNTDYDQAAAHSTDQTTSNIQLDREYTMTLSCTGDASDLPGYGYQDYTRYLMRDSNGVPIVQVKFPFPVEMPMRELRDAKTVVKDGNITASGNFVQADDNNKGLYKYYYANTWIDIEMIDEQGNIAGIVNQTVFIPSWATEDEKATITFRNVTMNCDANCINRNMQHEETNDYMTDAEDVYDTYYSDEDGTSDSKQVVDGSANKIERNNRLGWTADPKDTGKVYEDSEDLPGDDTTDNGKVISPFDERDYVAYKIEHDTVTGRISDFQIFDVSDYPAWQPVFRDYDKEKGRFSANLKGTSYHSGICNRYGFLGPWNSIFTTPIVGASNPTGKSNGTIGLGYKFRYKITTVGPYYNQWDKITIKPTFYFMNDKGEYLQEDGSYSRGTDKRKAIDVYYSETTSTGKKTLVKVGSDEDNNNRKSLNLKDDVWQTGANADWQVNKDRIDLTNDTLKSTRVGTTEDQYTFNTITMTPSMRLLCGDTHVSAHRALLAASEKDTKFDYNSLVYNKLKAIEKDPSLSQQYQFMLTKEVNSSKVLRSVQEWFGEYYLPSEIYTSVEDWGTIKQQIQQGFDGSEDCWLKGGRIVINFNPVLTSDTKQTLKYDNSKQTYMDLDDGKRVYEYAGCDQYKIENFVTSKMLTMGELLPFDSGDVIIYDMTLPGHEYDPKDPDKPDGPHDPDRNGPPKAPAASNAYGSSGSH